MDCCSNARNPKRFTLQIVNYCNNCSHHEKMVRSGLKKIGDIELISINLERRTFTVSTIKHPSYVIHALENLLDKEVILVHQYDDPSSEQSTGNIMNVQEIPYFLDKSSKNVNVDDLEISIKFNRKDRYGSATNGSMAGYASQIPVPSPQPMYNVRPSAPPLPQQEVYGYPVTTLLTSDPPPNYYYYGSSTSSDDQPNDYPCTIM